MQKISVGSGDVIQETDKAICVGFDFRPAQQKHAISIWFPLSQIDVERSEYNVDLWVPEWLLWSNFPKWEKYI